MAAGEYLPTTFRGSSGREYTIHVTIRVAAEVSRIHNMSLHELGKSHFLPLHVLLDVAEIGTRYQSTSAEEGREKFFDSIGDENLQTLALAAGNALINFSLRQRNLPEAKKIAIAKSIAEKYQEVISIADRALESLIPGDGQMFTGSPGQ